MTIQKGQDNPILRQKAKKVKSITPEIRELVLGMAKIMKTHEGIGLAAPQVGQSLRVIVVEHPQGVLALINPRITRKSFKKDILEEGCLSLPNIKKKIKRSVKITVKALNLKGESVKLKAEGLLARVIQHEVDHLNGVLISDK